jgi:hypothetical protein
VADGTRTRDHRDHNPELYQLSYRHLVRGRIAARLRRDPAGILGPGPVAQRIERQTSNLRAEVRLLPGPSSEAPATERLLFVHENRGEGHGATDGATGRLGCRPISTVSGDWPKETVARSAAPGVESWRALRGVRQTAEGQRARVARVPARPHEDRRLIFYCPSCAVRDFGRPQGTSRRHSLLTGTATCTRSRRGTSRATLARENHRHRASAGAFGM